MMKLFYHQLYEFEKGLRDLVMHTTHKSLRCEIVEKLERRDIPYLIYPVGPDRMNVFFGHLRCVEVVRLIGKPNLIEYDDEEDFILGIMLGYDRLKQCSRYLDRKNLQLRSDSQAVRRCGAGAVRVNVSPVRSSVRMPRYTKTF